MVEDKEIISPPDGYLQPEREAEKKELEISATVSSFSGPIPPPELIAAYEKVIHGSGERILRMAEEEAKHRKNMDLLSIKNQERLIDNDNNKQRKAQIFAFIISLGILIIAFYAIQEGAYHTAAIIVGTTITALAGVFIGGRLIQKKMDKTE